MEQCQEWAELKPLKDNLDLMLPWLDGWEVDEGAKRLFFRLSVHTQKQIVQKLGGNLGIKACGPSATLMRRIRRAEHEEGLVEPSKCVCFVICMPVCW